MPVFFLQLTAILAIATVLSVVMRRLGQPLMVGYLITGMVVGPFVLGIVHENDAVDTFASIGVALLLFLVGLRLKPQMIREIGHMAVFAGLGQIIFTSGVGFLIALALNFSWLTALYLSVAFTFSSTIVILQLLYTKEEQDSLHGRLATGVMLVQDVVAMIIFLFLSSAPEGATASVFVATILIKITLIITSVYILSAYVVPRIDKYFAQTREILFLFGLTCCFVFATAFASLGFSYELGALLAGVLLSASPYQRELAASVNTLRDFFLVMFFVVLGTHVSLSTFEANWVWISVFSAFILIGNPFIVMLLLRPAGYTLRTSFYTGLTVAQISEFSLILIATGAALGHIPTELFGPVAIIGIITIFFSSYFMMHSRSIFNFLEPMLVFFFGKDDVTPTADLPKTCDTILFGCHRLGRGLVTTLKTMRRNFIVVEHNPQITNQLEQENVPYIFGSADDPHLVADLPLANVKLAISTIPDLETNITLLSRLRAKNQKLIFICAAYQEADAEQLYLHGATYVVIPPYLGRRYLGDILKAHKLNTAGYNKERLRHQKDIRYIRDTIRI
ncbi:MAG: cation:proton antiporter [Patescibacteria group bacterium]|jgi:Kef-type K+ transport system membrane component KefB